MTPQHDIIPYWQRLGATHAASECGQEGSLFAQVVQSLNQPRYLPVLAAYHLSYHRAITKIEQAIAERERIARRHRAD